MAATKTQGRGPSKIELYSPSYFGACTMGGIIACGPTHTCMVFLGGSRWFAICANCRSCHPIGLGEPFQAQTDRLAQIGRLTEILCSLGQMQAPSRRQHLCL